MKRLLISVFVLIAVALASTRTTESFVRTPSSTGSPIAWNLTSPSTSIVSNGRITYNLNPAGSDNVPFAQVAQALSASFQAWEDIPTSAVAFTRGPDSSSQTTTGDNVLQVFWLESTTTTGDGLNVAGALALTRLTTITTGPAAGEIVDAAIVFNGNQYQWTTTGAANAVDIAEVATHEIGHAIGISHSPNGGATMFPRSAIGSTRSRVLTQDDSNAASVIYPAGNFLSATGKVSGKVRDNNGNPLFGAHVGVLDGNGVLVSGGLSQQDGSYSIPGLAPGNYQIYAEPLKSSTTSYFSKNDLTSFYSTGNTDFSPTQDFSFAVGAGQTASVDLTAVRGNPSIDGLIVYDAPNSGFLNVGTSGKQGQSNLTIGVAGNGLPQSGTPLSISGGGITFIKQYFAITNTGLTAVLADINISSSAALGPRNIVISNGSQRTVMSGALEILPGSGGGTGTVSVVSSANFTSSVAAESIASIFGSNLATSTVVASGASLPTSLGGTTVVLKDSQNNTRSAPLFFVSPTQINYQIAPGIQIGAASVTVTNGNNGVSAGSFQVVPVAPGLFSANASGTGLAAAVVLRIRNNVQTFEPILQGSSGTFTAIPIDLGPATDQVFLILYGTGFRFRSVLPTVTVGGSSMQVTFAAAQGSLVGLDQANVRLDRALIGRGSVNVLMTADGKTSNTVTVSIK